jgi:hypothetical protein
MGGFGSLPSLQVYAAATGMITLLYGEGGEYMNVFFIDLIGDFAIAFSGEFTTGFSIVFW